ncbi:hypothetical protein JCM10908_000836 [Rhodotorula pacifica]|uniref:SDR family oxidoreductase n=1 Tax=Rhodotorula pacifica TaxID=1495444 RepID=UPI00317BB0B4
MSTALVFGANGVSGLALLEALSQTSHSEWAKIIAVSRRPPVLDHKDERIKFVSIDLLAGKDEIVKKLSDVGAQSATHTFFYAYIAKEEENELVEVNKKLFGSALDAVAEVAPKLQVFLLQTGYKYYGTHKGGKFLAPYPWRAESARHEGQNFYYVHEDMLKLACVEHGWNWIVTRPNFILGFSKGNFMSLATTIALYATARKELGEPFDFPGTDASYKLEYDFSTASNNARFQIEAATNKKGYNRAFNISDDKPLTWAAIWPKIANYFGVDFSESAVAALPSDKKAGEDVVTPHSAADWAKSHESDFARLVKEHQLDPDSFKYATWDFLDFATARTWPDVATMDEARSIGWETRVDTFEEGFRPVFEKLREEKIIPASSSAA